MKEFMQSPFVENRCIVDNMLVAGEVIHYINKCRKGKSLWDAFKVDLLKAFDKILRDFLA